MSTNTHYRLYIAKEHALVPSRANVGKEPQNDFYLTDLENRLLHNQAGMFFGPKTILNQVGVFFDPKTKKNITRELKPGETVGVLNIHNNKGTPERFTSGKVYHLPEIAYIVLEYGAILSRGEYNNAYVRVNSKYADRIRAAQKKEDCKTEKKLTKELTETLEMLPKPLKFERLVRSLAVYLVMADRRQKLDKKK